MPYPPAPRPEDGGETSVAVRVGGAGLIFGGVLIAALVVLPPVFVSGGGDSWRWLDAFAGAGSSLAPVGAFVLVVTAAAAILGGIPVLAAGRRMLGYVGGIVGLFAGFVTLVCGLIFVIRLIGAGDLGQAGSGMWGLFPTGLWCLGFGIVAFIGGRGHR